MANRLTVPSSKRKKRGRPSGIAATIKFLSGLPDEARNIPQVKKALENIEGIANGTITGRNLQSRLAANLAQIEIWAGKPTKRNENEIGPSLAQLLAEASEENTN